MLWVGWSGGSATDLGAVPQGLRGNALFFVCTGFC